MTETQNMLEHSSGAFKIQRKHDVQPPFIWFPDCSQCRQGTIFIAYHCYDSTGQTLQCGTCYRRYREWLKAHHFIRYSISRSNYPIRLKIDTAKHLVKSKGRIFYHEVDYDARSCEGAYVEAYALDSDGTRQECLLLDGHYRKFFSTLPDAQAWIADQVGGSLRLFWFT